MVASVSRVLQENCTQESEHMVLLDDGKNCWCIGTLWGIERNPLGLGVLTAPLLWMPVGSTFAVVSSVFFAAPFTLTE